MEGCAAQGGRRAQGERVRLVLVGESRCGSTRRLPLYSGALRRAHRQGQLRGDGGRGTVQVLAPRHAGTAAHRTLLLLIRAPRSSSNTAHRRRRRRHHHHRHFLPTIYPLKAALLVNLYQDEPILNQAFRFLQKLMDIDELMTQWRHRHALMVRHLCRHTGYTAISLLLVHSLHRLVCKSTAWKMKMLVH